MRYIRLWPVEAKLHSIAPKFTWACIAFFSIFFVTYLSKVEIKTNQATMCLAENIYHEGRGESLDNQRTMGMLMLARITDPDKQWPKSICGSAAQDRAYSWVLEYRLATNRDEQRAWKTSQSVARDLIENAWSKYKLPAGWECARYYKVTGWKSKYFATKLLPVGSFGKHTAYEDRKGCRIALPTS
ncbi:MAG: cell wall hydrolase [Candidatus Pacebacteria bacterium]|nr:cell wall hydrolase [Candidatus Paceibacterota bacterium]